MMSLRQLHQFLGPETTRLLATFKNESEVAVIRRAVKLLALADGHVDRNGKILVRQRPEKKAG